MTKGVTDLPDFIVDKLFGRHRKVKPIVEESIQKTGLKLTLQSGSDPRFLRYIAYIDGSDSIDVGFIVFFQCDYWEGVNTGSIMSYGDYREKCVFIAEADAHLAGEYALKQLDKLFKQPLDEFYAKHGVIITSGHDT
jgi:hypothetical protein